VGKINSRDKGKRGELDWRDFLLMHGITARRGAQYSGGSDSPDVVADTPGWHAEVKRTECLNLYNAMDQATGDAKGKIPYVAHRKNKRPWVVIIPANAWVQLIQLQKLLTQKITTTLPGVLPENCDLPTFLSVVQKLNVTVPNSAPSAETPGNSTSVSG
jgi:Holliday junction resolvase